MRGISHRFEILKVLSFFLSLILIIPILYILIYGYTSFYIGSVAFSRTLLSSIALTFFSSAIAVIIAIVFFTPLAYYLARHKNPFIETLVDIPASIPHPVVGIALIFLDSPINPLGKFLYDHGIIFYYTYTGLILALFIVSTPVYVRAMQNYFESLPQSYEIYARSLGASEFRIYTTVILPRAVKGIISAGLTAIARAISEFGSVVLIAPYVTGWIFNGMSTASVFIYDEFLTYFNASITASATLILFSVLLIAITRVINIILFK